MLNSRRRSLWQQKRGRERAQCERESVDATDEKIKWKFFFYEEFY